MKEKSISIKLFDEIMTREAHTVDLQKLIKQLERQYDFIEKILESTIEFINVFDIDLNFLTINKKTEIILKMKREDIIGKNFKDVFPGSLESVYYKNLRGAAKGYSIDNSSSQGPTGQYYNTSFIPLIENDLQYGVLVVARDVTEYVLNTKEMEKLNDKLRFKNDNLLNMHRQLNDFANTLNPEIRQQLKTILSAIKE